MLHRRHRERPAALRSALERDRDERRMEHPVTGKGQRRTFDADRPKQTPLRVEQLVERVASGGDACGAFARAAIAERGELAARTLFGVLHLLRNYDRAEVERACELAVTAGSWRLRFLRAYLERHARRQTLRTEDPIIHSFERYIDHFSALKNGEHT